MPVIRRRSAVRREDLLNLSDELIEDLLYGFPIIGRGFGRDIESFREAWRLNRDQLLQRFVDEYPGRRPYGEWVCRIIPEFGERPVLRPVPSFEKRRFGILHSDLFTLGPTGERRYAQQPEILYLARHDLLQDGELAKAKEHIAHDLSPGRFVWPDDLED